MNYEKYLEYFNMFNTNSGYYAATKLLLFQGKWVQFNNYKNFIDISIKAIKSRLNKNSFDIADMCCGEYAWISRHFSKMSNKIYCVDNEDAALNSKVIRENKKCIAIKRDVSEKIFNRDSLDFIFCGFTLHYNFIKNFIYYLRTWRSNVSDEIYRWRRLLSEKQI
ncbi:hypothetical protein M1141_01325 [Candidatus Marsarchaeota archaeon]|nr:hypothetical protein [Candidatus Marsarchaeota archaeon]